LLSLVLCFTDAAKCFGILVLPQHLREKLDTLVARSTDTTDPSKPTILVPEGRSALDGDLSIHIERVVLCNTNSFAKAIALLLASYYIFNLAYPSKGVATLTFIQKCILNLHDGSKNIDKVVTLLGRLNKL
jgi:hypothetical protein